MAFLQWEESYSVGIISIDNQHKKLIELINQFYENLNTSSNKELISELIKGMKNYTILHFKAEEQYLKQYKYPDFDNHKKEHDSFLQKVNDLEERYISGKLIISFEITSFLKTWIRSHILETDMKYSDFLKKQGLK